MEPTQLLSPNKKEKKCLQWVPGKTDERAKTPSKLATVQG